MYDVVALGELLIDFVSNGNTNYSELFMGNPGGAPANVLASLAKMGRKTAFIGKVGNDHFGHFLKKALITEGIDTNGLVISGKESTTLAFVHLDDVGERSFSFYRNPGADRTLTESEVDLSLIQNAHVFHFGAVSMTHEPVRTATLKTVEYAKQNGCRISFDPNLRLSLWEDSEEAKCVIRQCLPFVDLLKVSEEELEFLTGETSPKKGADDIFSEYGTKIILVTMGQRGCFYYFDNENGHVPAPKVNTTDTTGAGDAFVAGILHKIIDFDNSGTDLNVPELENLIWFANVVAALSTTKKGGITSMPSLSEIESFVKQIDGIHYEP